MDIAAMKTAGKGKASAKPNASVAKGAALAHIMVEYAWKAAEEVEKRAGKLALFVKDICALDAEGHSTFRTQLTMELKSIDELEKVSGNTEARKSGYSLNSFKVMVSNWRSISEAAQIGFKGVDKDGNPLPWTVALESAREYRKSHASAGTQRTATGKALGAGRKAMSAYDKVLRDAAKLDRKDQKKLFEALGAMFKATIAYPVKASAKAGAASLEQAPVLH